MAQQIFVIPASVASGPQDDSASGRADAVPDSSDHLYIKDVHVSSSIMRLLLQKPVRAKPLDTPPAPPSSPSIFEFVDVTYRELKVSELLCLCFCGICCPRRTASTLAFWPPCPPTYQLYYDEDSAKTRIILEDTSLCPYSVDYLENVHRLEVFTTTSAVHGNSIACVHLSCGNNPKYTILKSHANAVDVGQEIDLGVMLGMQCQCNFVVYDYSGYGRSTGKYSERNIYADAAAVFQELLSRYRLEPSDVVLCGLSIGTVPTVDLATKVDVAGVILCCPLASALRTVFPCVSNTWFFDSFPK